VSEPVNGHVRTSGRTCARTRMRLHVHWPRASAGTKIRSTQVDLNRPYFNFCTREAKIKIGSTQVDLLFVRTRARGE